MQNPQTEQFNVELEDFQPTGDFPSSIKEKRTTVEYSETSRKNVKHMQGKQTPEQMLKPIESQFQTL